MKQVIPKPISGGLILSYKCSAQCRHCMYACTPKWEADWISKQDLETILAGLARTIEPSPYGPDTVTFSHGLHFSGGEPFLNFELLCQATQMAAEFGIPSTFVETNCFWANDDKITKDKLQCLKEKGMKGIMISVNPFYLEYVPFERTERTVRIAYEVFGRNMMVYQIEYFKRFLQMGLKHRISFEDYLRLEDEKDFSHNTEFFISGRAPYKVGINLNGIYPKYSASMLCKATCSPPFLREWHNHFDNYGNYMPGFCGGISLGNSKKLDQIIGKEIDPKEHPVLYCLANDDMAGLLRMAKDLGYQEMSDGYYSKCHLCMDIRKHLVNKANFKELTPREMYEFVV